MNKVNKRGLINILLLVSVFAYIYFAYRNELIPFKYQLVGFGIVLLLFFLGIYFRNLFMKILLFVLIIGLSFVHLKAQDMLSMMFVDDHEQQQTKSKTISMIALKDKYIDDDFYKEARYGTSNELDLDFHQYLYNDLAEEFDIVPSIKNSNYNVDMAGELYNGEIDILILDESQREDLLKHYPGLNETTQVLRTFEKEIIIESNAIRVNPQRESFAILLTATDNWGEETDHASLNDVNIVAFVNPRINQITLLSIPRDTYVPLACKNGQKDKLTHTGMYGDKCQVDTLKDFLGVDINYSARVNFSTLVHVVEVLGGSINLYNPYAFQGHTSEYYFEEGCLTLDGLATLNYARTRYELPDGDFGRQENQKRVINSLLKKVTNPQRILNMGSIFSELSEIIETNIDTKFVNYLISYQLDKWPDWQMNSLSFSGYDGNEYTYSYPNELLYVFLPDQNQLDEVKENIAEFMSAKSISEVAFLNPTPTPEPEVTEPVEPAEPAEPVGPVIPEEEPEIIEPEIYKPIINENIRKHGIHITPFTLDNQNNFTKEQYIQACEATYSK